MHFASYKWKILRVEVFKLRWGDAEPPWGLCRALKGMWSDLMVQDWSVVKGFFIVISNLTESGSLYHICKMTLLYFCVNTFSVVLLFHYFDIRIDWLIFKAQPSAYAKKGLNHGLQRDIRFVFNLSPSLCAINVVNLPVSGLLVDTEIAAPAYLLKSFLKPFQLHAVLVNPKRDEIFMVSY